MDRELVKNGTWGTCEWAIDNEGKLYIGEGIAPSTEAEELPWGQYTEYLTAVEIVGNVTMALGGSMKNLFKGGHNLRSIKLRGIDTTGVVSMAGMFEECSEITDLDLTGFNTESVKDMSKMFCGCRKLSLLDVSSFNTFAVTDMRRMFSKCNSLHSVFLGEAWDIERTEEAGCDRIVVTKNNGKYRTAKVVNAGGARIGYFENRGENGYVERKSVSGFNYQIEDLMFPAKGEGYVFVGWNTEADGSGYTIEPGVTIEKITDDLDLYAKWVGLPRVGAIEELPEIEYGQPLPFELPEIISENDEKVSGHLEISPDGAEGTWEKIDHSEILPASRNGHLVRLSVSNSAGVAVSNAVHVRIKKVIADMSRVHWVEAANMVYDGQEKHVWLEGLPEGVHVIYEGNAATEAGEYSASVELDYDEENIFVPVKIRAHSWTIYKARYEMNQVSWTTDDEMVYDGTEKRIRVEGIPEGIEVTYEGNSGISAGIRTATASLSYDKRNYEKPADVIPCRWEIAKAVLDASELKWTESRDYVFDGTAKSVQIENLPEDATVEYYGETASQAGKYLAIAALSGNYTATAPLEHEWEIKKAVHDMSEVKWQYEEPFTYNRESHEVYLANLPDGVAAKYYNNVAQTAGDYFARASFVCEDSHNFETPDDMSLMWTIDKKALDMSNVRWDYESAFTYDGDVKSIQLIGLPEGVYATLDNAAATNAGVYTAHANLKYDDKNLYAEQPADCQWQINKARFDVSDVYWNYNSSFTYDGTEKKISLVNVPSGLNVDYWNNARVEAGKYAASAKLSPVDAHNYLVPEVNGCTWSISKAPLTLEDVEWSEFDEFVYDGTDKEVVIESRIGDGINVTYTGNVESAAGKHTATAHFAAVDDANFKAPEDIRFQWEIAKGEFDLKDTVWDYTSAYTYDGQRKEVKLNNVPAGLTVNYENNTATETGEYNAVAHFQVQNEENYNPVPSMSLQWNIEKAAYDMSQVKWQDEKAYSYDGGEKKVELVGLPDGLKPVYRDNAAVNAADYLATVDFDYDEKNYEKPSFADCRWKIEKSNFNTGNARWGYEEPFVYDGTPKTVGIVDLPEGAGVEYSNITAVNAGTYAAVADIIAEDTENYNNVRMDSLLWRIEKGHYDMSYAYWDYETPFTYDGLEKKIVLKGLPEGVFPQYQNNTATDAGCYEAQVTFKVEDPDNYNVPTFAGCKWIIGKADLDMSSVKWNYSKPFTYNGKIQEVQLEGLPSGVRAVYENNCATAVGGYRAEAKLIRFDERNYKEPIVEGCSWEIVKADYDMSQVKWDYTAAKVYNHRAQGVELENLPGGVYAEYQDNEATVAGTYTAKAKLRVTDEANYNIPSFGECSWTIGKAHHDMSAVRWSFKPGELVYDGTEKKIGLENLPAGVTATYTGNSAVDAGHYTATADFQVENDNYDVPESISFDWFIDRAACDMSAARWDYQGEFTYDRNPHSVHLIGVPDQLEAEYQDNRAIDAGIYNAVASFTVKSENYRAPENMICTWSIGRADIDISGISWDYDKSFVYDGENKTVVLAGVPGILNVRYEGNEAVNVGNYHAQASLTPVDTRNYNIPTVKGCEWSITKSSFDMRDAHWVNNGPFTYNGMEQGVYVEGLPEGVEAVYAGESAIDAGEYVACAEFVFDEDNYYAPEIEDCEWEIVKSSFDMKNAAWNFSEPFVYDGSVKAVEITGLPEGVTAVYTGNTGVDAGSYRATAELICDENNYIQPTIEGISWSIDKAELPINPADLKWTYNSPFIYDGQAKTVALAEETEELGFVDKLRGKTAASYLVGVPAGVEAVYEGNTQTDVGIYFAKVTLRHVGDTNYREYQAPALKWEIRKASYDMSEVKWDYEGPFTYDGTEKGVQLTGVPAGVNVTYTGNIGLNAGSYEAEASFGLEDADNYNMPNPVKGCWWQINKAEYDMDAAHWTTESGPVYDGKEKTLVLAGLPEGVSVEAYSGNSATEAGTYIADAVLSYANQENYEKPEINPVRWTISKKFIDTSDVRWNYDQGTMFVYDEQPKEVKLIGLPEDVEVVYVNNVKINAGDYVARARLTYDTKNYEAEQIEDCKWSIAKANIDTSQVHWDYQGAFQYDAGEKTVALCNVPGLIDVRYRDNKASGIGKYTAKAYLTYNRENYNEPEINTTLDWEIVRVLDGDAETEQN